MSIQTEAIVLKTYPFRESSLIIQMYTDYFGKLSVLSKGVHQLKSRKISHFENFNLIDCEIYYRPKRELQLVGTTNVINYFPRKSASLEVYCFASYAIELLKQLTEEEEPNDVIFRLIKTYLSGLQLENHLVYSVAFELKLLKLLGIFPNLLECSSCHEKIDGRAKASFDHGGVVCERAECINRFNTSEWIYPVQLRLIFLLIKKTFVEINQYRNKEKELRGIHQIIEKYIRIVTNGKIKSEVAMHEIIG